MSENPATTFNDLPVDVVCLIVDEILKPLTWIGLYRPSNESRYGLPQTNLYRGDIDTILRVQDLKTLSRAFCKSVTRWFQREWNSLSWSTLFRRVVPYYCNVPVRVIACDYFRAITKHDLHWDHNAHNRGGSFRIYATKECGVREIKYTIFVLYEICQVDWDITYYGNEYRYSVCWDIKTGKLVDPRPICYENMLIGIAPPVEKGGDYNGEVLLRSMWGCAGYDYNYDGEICELTDIIPHSLLREFCWINPRFVPEMPDHICYGEGMAFRWRNPIPTDTTEKDGEDIANLF